MTAILTALSIQPNLVNSLLANTVNGNPPVKKPQGPANSTQPEPLKTAPESWFKWISLPAQGIQSQEAPASPACPVS